MGSRNPTKQQVLKLQNLIKIESYLTKLTYNNRRLLARFRCRNHNLPVETGCHRGIPREQRKCNWCVSELGDEFYFIMNCSNFNTLRSQLIKRHHTIRSSSFTFDKLMNTSSMLELKNFCTYIRIVQKSINSCI